MPVTFQQSPARAFVESPARERNRGGATQRSGWGHYQWPGLRRTAGFSDPGTGGGFPTMSPVPWSDDGLHYLYFRSRLNSFSYFEEGALYITRRFREIRLYHHPLFSSESGVFLGGDRYKITFETSCDGLFYTAEILDDGAEVQTMDRGLASEKFLLCPMLDVRGDDGFGRNVSFVRVENPSPNVFRHVFRYDPGGRPVFPASPTADSEFITADSEAYTADAEGVLGGAGTGLLDIVYEWEVGTPMSWRDARAQAIDLIDTIHFESPSRPYLVATSRSRNEFPGGAGSFVPRGPYLLTGEIRPQRPGERFLVEWLRYKNPFPQRPEFDAGKLPVIFAAPEDPFAYPTLSNFPLDPPRPPERAKAFVRGRDQLYFDLAKQLVPGAETKRYVEELTAAIAGDGTPVAPFHTARRRTRDAFAAFCRRYRQVGGALQYHPECIETLFGAYLATVPEADSPLWP
jgi:hypothetical protein